MHDMKIVVEEQQAPEQPGFDHGGAVAGLLMGTMLGERAQQAERDRRIDRQSEIFRQRDPADAAEPDDQHRNGQAMAQPDSGIRAAPQLGPPAAGDQENRADQQPAQQRRIPPAQRPIERAAAGQRPGRQVMRFRVAVWISQIGAGMGMMRQMGCPIARIGQPERQRRRADQSVEPARGRRMVMDRLMLQRAVPGQQQRRERCCQPKRQRRPEPGDQGEAAIDHGGDAKRGQLPTGGQSAPQSRSAATRSAAR